MQYAASIVRDSMDVYSALVRAVQTEYDTVRLLKESARGRVALVRRRSSGERYVFRQFEGGGGVYRRLLEVTNPHLPVIYEAGSLSGRTAVLEEYVRGDTLAFLLEAGELGVREARDIARQLCEALWVLHSMGAVHRDIKPENVLLRGSEAVLIDFDAARFFRPERERGHPGARDHRLRRAGAVRPRAVGRAGGHIFPRRAAERHADPAASLARDRAREDGADSPEVYDDKPGAALPECAGSYGGPVNEQGMH